MADGELTPRTADKPLASTARAADEPRALVAPPVAADPPEPHVARFRIAYAFLAVVLGAAVGALIVLVGRGSAPPGAAWSSWKPVGSNPPTVQQIASHVGREYRLGSGKELVAVIPQAPPSVQSGQQAVPIEHIVYAASPAEDISVYPSGNSVEYLLCGVGSSSGSCAIGEGKPTVKRARLLHRESLELALYTFKYADGVDSVVTVQPPKSGQNPSFALFFRKGDFSNELGRPLEQTLGGQAPFTLKRFPVREQAEIAQLVTPHLFRFSYQQAPDGSAVMVLQPPSA